MSLDNSLITKLRESPIDYCIYYCVIDNEKGKDWVLQKLNVTINFLENIRERQLKRLSHTIGNTTA